MSDFNAKILAMLDTTKIPGQIKGIEKNTTITLKKFTLDTSTLPSQIQASLDGHKFKISLDGIKMGNISTDMGKQANKLGGAFATSLVQRINTQLSNGGIESSIAKVVAQYEKYGATGHSKLGQIKKDIESLGRIQVGMENAGSAKSLISHYENFNRLLVKVKNNLSTVAAENKTFVSSTQLQSLDNKMASWLANNSKATKDYGKEIDLLREKIAHFQNVLNTGGVITSSQFNEVKQGYENITVEATKSGKIGKTFTDTFNDGFKVISRYVSAAALMYQGVDALKQMYQNVYDIDTAMTNLYKVTDETGERYTRFLNDSKKSAQDLGRTVSSLITQTSEWAKLGFTLDKAQELAKLSSIYANVAEVGDSTAVSDMVTAMKAFNIESSNAITIIDSLNALGKLIALTHSNMSYNKWLYRLKSYGHDKTEERYVILYSNLMVV